MVKGSIDKYFVKKYIVSKLKAINTCREYDEGRVTVYEDMLLDFGLATNDEILKGEYFND